MADLYANFAELKAARVQGTDYNIEYKERPSSDVLITALHGGGIEIGTTEIAKCVAGSKYNLWNFEGLLSSGNGDLHITSTNYDEPTALRLHKAARLVVGIHGMSGDAAQEIYMGGNDTVYRDKIRSALVRAGFTIGSTPEEINGDNPNNITNKNIRGVGVQLELSRGLRNAMFDNPVGATNRKNTKNQLFYDFCNAVKYGIYGHKGEIELVGRRGSLFY